MKRKEEVKNKQQMGDLDFYERIGKTSSDKFYVNEDKRRVMEAALKGGSRTVAVTIGEKYTNKL